MIKYFFFLLQSYLLLGRYEASPQSFHQNSSNWLIHYPEEFYRQDLSNDLIDVRSIPSEIKELKEFCQNYIPKIQVSTDGEIKRDFAQNSTYFCTEFYSNLHLMLNNSSLWKKQYRGGI